ncbi:hypothetical protein [Streptomyces jeddahensis]|uniref:Uncharacterized protein n=1 Tax=Streptomyces jeddahensis TaxID=1716141 RepID=A0A177HSN1_9ACTN|nr:hypothetical protein [Streptomyces jeddahensis]OAH13194.1 hypothetical protein STSP_35190 [Streptomyces jeddahensis]
MADERSQFPGGEDAGGSAAGDPRTPGGRTPGHTPGRTPSFTPDRPAGSPHDSTHGAWLDGDAAERLLRGEPVDEQARPQAHRLAATLRALTDEGRFPAAAELPGESAALAAFRQARAERRAEHSAYAGTAGRLEHPERLGHPGRPVYAEHPETRRGRGPGRVADHLDGGSVRLGVHLGRAGADRAGVHRAAPARGLGRPVRFALAALLAGCMIGGVAVAAGSGVLPSLFGGEGEPGPGVSVSAAATPEHPAASPAPDAPEADGGTGTPESGSSSSGPGDDASSPGAAGQGEDSTQQPGNGDAGRSEEAEQWRRTVALCREYSAGKKLDDEKWRYLEDSAEGNGAGRVDRYCEGVLNKADAEGGTKGSNEDGGDGDNGGNGGDSSEKGNSSDKGADEDDVSDTGNSVEKSGSDAADSSVDTDAPTATPTVLTSGSAPEPTATASYSALPAQ